jgi:hypothetical protein
MLFVFTASKYFIFEVQECCLEAIGRFKAGFSSGDHRYTRLENGGYRMRTRHGAQTRVQLRDGYSGIPRK